MRAGTTRAVTLAVALAVAPGAWCAEPQQLAPVTTWAVDEHTTGLLVEDHRVPLISVRLEFPAGTWSRWARDAALEPALRSALYDPAGRLRRRVDDLAAGVTLSVDERYSAVSARCLKEDLPAVVELLKEILANESLDRTELRLWRRSARLTYRALETDVQFRSSRLVARTLTAEDDPRRLRYERPRKRKTDPATLNALRARLLRLPGRTVGLAGDLTPAEARELAAGLLPPADTSRLPDLGLDLQPLVPRAQRRDTTDRIAKLTQVYFGLARESVSMADPDWPAFVMANHVLGGHFYSRLYVALRHEGGETYGAVALAEGDTEPGALVLASFTRVANAGHAEEKLRRTLATFRSEGITQAERAETAARYRGRVPFTRQTPEGVLDRLLYERRLGLPTGSLDALPERMAALTLAEINEFIAGYYDPASFVMVRVAPAGE